MQKLLKFLKKYGLEKQTSQTMAEFLEEAQQELNISFDGLKEMYNGLKYKQEYQKSNIPKLKYEIKKASL
ncbi:MAG: hypothetical protein DSZ04_00650 [Sulfurimonas sp.]|nr:MAG: hypothetical protein DSZ04_00650 [Sulfurimonas sp.]